MANTNTNKTAEEATTIEAEVKEVTSNTKGFFKRMHRGVIAVSSIALGATAGAAITLAVKGRREKQAQRQLTNAIRADSVHVPEQTIPVGR